MRSIVGSTFFTMAVVTAIFQGPTEARAADMPLKAAPAPAWSWTGFYIGADVGAAWGPRDVSFNSTDGKPCHFCGGDTDFGVLNALGSANLKTSSAALGLKGGYNAQFGSWVLGVEGDFTSFHLRNSAATSGNPFAAAFAEFDSLGGFANFNTNVSADWLVTVRPRIGYALDHVLVYATGGVAFGRVAISQSYIDFAVDGNGNGLEASSASRVKAGWTVGGGVEYALTRNWIVNAEYLYTDLGSITTAGSVRDSEPGGLSNALLTFTSRAIVNQARAGLSYKFD